MKLHEIIVRPLLTEKGSGAMEAKNDYSFEVSKKANKVEIAQAITKLFKVRVVGVRTLTMPGKRRRSGFTYRTSSDWKKAIVRLHPEDQLDLL